VATKEEPSSHQLRLVKYESSPDVEKLDVDVRVSAAPFIRTTSTSKTPTASVADARELDFERLAALNRQIIELRVVKDNADRAYVVCRKRLYVHCTLRTYAYDSPLSARSEHLMLRCDPDAEIGSELRDGLCIQGATGDVADLLRLRPEELEAALNDTKAALTKALNDTVNAGIQLKNVKNERKYVFGFRCSFCVMADDLAQPV